MIATFQPEPYPKRILSRWRRGTGSDNSKIPEKDGNSSFFIDIENAVIVDAEPTPFSIGVTSAVGLLLSFAIGHWVLSISFESKWLAPVGVFCVVCVAVAWCAWWDGRQMVRFMAQMPDALLSAKAPDKPAPIGSTIESFEGTA